MTCKPETTFFVDLFMKATTYGSSGRLKNCNQLSDSKNYINAIELTLD